MKTVLITGCSSGYGLGKQLKKHGVHQLIVIGLIASTCGESTVRFGAELGCEVTMVRDATASYSDEEMHASLDVNIPYYASAIVSTEEIVAFDLGSLAGRRGESEVVPMVTLRINGKSHQIDVPSDMPVDQSRIFGR